MNPTMSFFLLFLIGIALTSSIPITIKNNNNNNNNLNKILPETPIPGCYKNTTTRGVGVPISTCPAGQQLDAGLCYQPCPSGYTGVGPVCWQNCPPGFTDTGAFCQPEIVSGDNSNCPAYDKCGLIEAKGCVICPANFTASGCLCNDGTLFAKQTVDRGVGTPMVCAAGLEYDAGLCYPACPGSLDGIGPVCWASCVADFPYGCGAICVSNEEACNATIENVASALYQLIDDLWECVSIDNCDPSSIKQAIAQLIAQFDLQICQY
jgi:hypothetical protein